MNSNFAWTTNRLVEMKVVNQTQMFWHSPLKFGNGVNIESIHQRIVDRKYSRLMQKGGIFKITVPQIFSFIDNRHDFLLSPGQRKTRDSKTYRLIMIGFMKSTDTLLLRKMDSWFSEEINSNSCMRMDGLEVLFTVTGVYLPPPLRSRFCRVAYQLDVKKTRKWN